MERWRRQTDKGRENIGPAVARTTETDDQTPLQLDA